MTTNPYSGQPVPGTTQPAAGKLTQNEQLEIVANALLSRTNLVEQLLDPRRDIDEECGYAATVTREMYRRMFMREGVAARVVSIYPDECWARPPQLYETEDPEETTAFEKAWQELSGALTGATHFAPDDQTTPHAAWAAMHEADVMSGVGHFGITVIGLGDNQSPDLPAKGLDPKTGKPDAKPPATVPLLWLRSYDHSLVDIKAFEQDKTSKRYGLPTMYTVKVANVDQVDNGMQASEQLDHMDVHWTRVLHHADNRMSSPVWGQPRQQRSWNRLYDLRKVMGGSGEMFWRGGFPGVSLETHPQLENAEVDVKATREMMYDYMNGLQRYIMTNGMTAKSLTPQVADPTAVFKTIIQAICIDIGVPYRVFMGTEEGKLAGDQDNDAWLGRLHARRLLYLTPHVVCPFVDRMIHLGVLPVPGGGYRVNWPDLAERSEDGKAETAKKWTEALAAYVNGDCEQAMPPTQYFTQVWGMTQDEAEELADAVDEWNAVHDAELEAQAADAAANGGLDPITGQPIPAPDTPADADEDEEEEEVA